MTKSNQDLLDRAELQSLTVAYANAIDFRRWDALDLVFTLDASIDYTASGGTSGAYPEIKPWLAKSLSIFKSYMHLMGNFHFEISGDTATGVVACYNPMTISPPWGGSRTVVFGIWYHDRYVRTPAGWRIESRRQELCYTLNVPLWMRIGTYLYQKTQARQKAT